MSIRNVDFADRIEGAEEKMMKTGLLASGIFERLQNGVTNFFGQFQFIFAVEILFFFLLIYFVSKILRDNDATKLMLFYWCLILVGGAMHVFAETLLDKQFFLFFVLLVSAFMLILFNVEVKKALWDVHSAKDGGADKVSYAGAEVRPHADTERCINDIIV